MSEEFLAAVIAMHVTHDKSANLDIYLQFIEQAAHAGVSLIVFPEASLQGYLIEFKREFNIKEAKYHRENAETVPGPSTNLIENWASKRNLHVVFGLLEIDNSGSKPSLYNTAVLVGPQGYIGKYRKVHQPLDEQLYYRSGDSWPVFETSLGRIGLMICYDQNFPESARELTLKGAELLIIPSAWAELDDRSASRYEIFGRARAAENNRWIIQSNQVGRSDKGSQSYIGCSRVIDRNGTIIAQTPLNETGMITAQIQSIKSAARKGHSQWYLRHRKPSTYQHLTQMPSPPDDKLSTDE